MEGGESEREIQKEETDRQTDRHTDSTRQTNTDRLESANVISTAFTEFHNLASHVIIYTSKTLHKSGQSVYVHHRDIDDGSRDKWYRSCYVSLGILTGGSC